MLGVSLESTDKEVKQAYRRLALQHHPDKQPDDPLASRRERQLATVLFVEQSEDVVEALSELPWRAEGRQHDRASQALQIEEQRDQLQHALSLIHI